jgi:murein DD-endopeptidase MepM/ murein hydrolase activator NlpD
MKRNLFEELKRIHSITYGEQVIGESNLLNKILSSVGIDNVGKSENDPKKADMVSTDVDQFFDNLESIEEPIFQESYGSMNFQRNVESVQIGLILLGYELPKFGVDGLFGPETANAVNKFKLDNNIKDQSIEENINESVLMSPVPTSKITSQYGEKRSYEDHPGVDLAVPSGTEIKSPADGKVIDSKFKTGGCGGTIQIEHGDGFTSRYCHCKEIRVSIGDTVKQGEIIGLTGGGPNDKGKGNSRGPHLHFELKKNGGLVNPLNYIGTNVGEYDLNREDKESANINPEMVKVLITKLKQRGVTDKDLSNLVDTVKTGGGTKFTDIDLTTEEGVEKYRKICDLFISTRRNNLLNITGKMLVNSAVKAYERYRKFVPPELALSQLTIEGGFTDDPSARPIKTKNPFNVGNVDSGKDNYQSDVQTSIDKYYYLIASNYLGKGKTASDLINNFVNKEGNRYASNIQYEKQLNQMASYVNKISQSVI